MRIPRSFKQDGLGRIRLQNGRRLAHIIYKTPMARKYRVSSLEIDCSKSMSISTMDGASFGPHRQPKMLYDEQIIALN